MKKRNQDELSSLKLQKAIKSFKIMEKRFEKKFLFTFMTLDCKVTHVLRGI